MKETMLISLTWTHQVIFQFACESKKHLFLFIMQNTPIKSHKSSVKLTSYLYCEKSAARQTLTLFELSQGSLDRKLYIVTCN